MGELRQAALIAVSAPVDVISADTSMKRPEMRTLSTNTTVLKSAR